MAIALATAGGLLVYSGIQGLSPLVTLRSIMQGTVPKGSPATPAAIPPELAFLPADAASGGGTGSSPSDLGTAGASALGTSIVAAARRYIGVPYRWGGATPDGFDCSGLVTWVLHHDLGYHLPSAIHTTSAQFLVWSGASTLPNGAPILPGDLVCWAGHIGIAVDAQTMIDAPQTGETVKQQRIWTIPAPIYRRVKAQNGASSAVGGGGNAAGGGLGSVPNGGIQA